MAFAERWTIALIVIAISTSMSAKRCAAAELPQYVKGPISGLIHDCRQAGQKLPKPEAYVSIGDLDGDGKPDHIVDTAKGCTANTDLYCNAEGCVVDVYLSSTGAEGGSFRARTVRIAKHGSKPALVIVKGGDTCGTNGCTVELVYDGKAFVEVK